MNGTVRPIQFVVVDSLQSSKLGKEECHKWADVLMNEITHVGGVVENDVKVMLPYAYLLLSGCPRGLQRLVAGLKERDYWSEIKEYLAE